MAKYIQFTNNKLSARYDSAINTVIPPEAIEVTDVLFFQTINEYDGIWSLDVDGVTIIKAPFPAVTSEALIAEKLTSLQNSFNNEISAITATYSQSEILSWDKQETEARAWTANSSVVTPLIDALATARELTKAELVTRIIAKAEAFAVFSGSLIGKRQKLEDQVIALGATATKEQLDLITW